MEPTRKRCREDDNKENGDPNRPKNYKENFTVQKTMNSSNAKGICKICKQVIPMAERNTVGLKRHLERKHKFVYEQYFPEKSSNKKLDQFVSNFDIISLIQCTKYVFLASRYATKKTL